MKRTAAGLSLAMTAMMLSACFGGRTLEPRKVEPVAEIAVDRDAAVERLAQAVRLKTISHQDPAQFDAEPFLALHRHLETSFPLVHKNLKREVINDYTLLYSWPGTDPSLKPALFMAHMDVVPVEEAGLAKWTKPPFDGLVEDGYLWGRGTLDDKGNVLAALEGAEHLLRQGYKPARTILFEFGHDEEISGLHGAAAVAELLKSRGTQLEFVMDEGMAVIEPGVVPGVKDWIAFVGIAEKGYVTFELTARAEGGHSSQPTTDSAIGRLAAGLVRLEENQMPAKLGGPARDMLRYLGPEASAPFGMIYGNLWLFGPVVKGSFTASPQSNALLRTTTAVTVIHAGAKENILPTEATALVNHRILPGDTVDSVEEHVRRTLKDEKIEVKRDADEAGDPSPVSPLDSAGMQTLVKTIREIYPDAAVTPGLVLGATDSRYFAELTDSVYRFGPMRFRKADFPRVHGVDERVGIDDYVTAIRFYARMLENTGSPQP